MKSFFVFYWRAAAGTQAGNYISSGLDGEGEWTTKNTDCFKHTPLDSHQSPTTLPAYHGKSLQ